MNYYMKNGMPVVFALLDRLALSKNASQIISAFKEIINVLCSEERERHLFYLCRGVQKISAYLDHVDQEVSEYAYYILGYTAGQHEEIKKSLTTGAMFDRLSRAIAAQQCAKGGLSSAIFLLSVVMVGNNLAHELVRESGCLSKLLHLFILMSRDSFLHEWQTGAVKTVLQKWCILCTALSVSINPSVSDANQAEARIVLPQAVGLLNFWNRQAEYNKYLMRWAEMVAWLIATIIAGNETNQEQFFWLNGITVIVRALSRYEKLETSTKGFHYRMLCLLDASVYKHNRNCEMAVKLSVIPLMLRALQRGDSKVILIALMVLTHLIERCPNNCRVFSREGGPEIVVGVTQHFEGNTDIVNAANLLWQYIEEFTSATQDFTPLTTHGHGDKWKSDVGVARTAEISLAQLMRSGANMENIFSDSMTWKGQVPIMGRSTTSRSISTKCTENVFSCASELNCLCELCEGNDCDKAEIQQCKGETSVISPGGNYSFKILSRLMSVCGKLFSNRNNSCAENLLGEKVNKTFNGKSSNTSSEECRSCNNQQSFVHQNSVGVQTTPSISNRYKKFDAKFSNRSTSESKKETSLMTARKAVFSARNDSNRTEVCKARNLASSSHGNMNYSTWQNNIGKNSTSTPLKLRTSILATTPSKAYKDHSSCTPSTSSVRSDLLVCVRKFSEAELVNLFKGVELHGPNFRAILSAFPFHPKRTSRELYLKWRSIKKQSVCVMQCAGSR